MITVYSVTLTCSHVVVVLMANIVETGISLMELNCRSLEMVILLRIVELNELTYNNANSPSGIYRCFITTEAVQDNSVRETVYVGLYTTGGMSLYVY